MPEGVSRLIVSRGLRSFVQGFLNVAFPLYLLRLGVSTVWVGVVFTASAVVSAVLTLGVGLFADRWGRRPFILAFAGLTSVSGLVFLLSKSFWVLAPIAVLAGLGRGGAGGGGAQGGAFSPAEQSLLAEKSGDQRRTPVFALNAAVGSYAGAAGALLSGMGAWLALPGRPLFGYEALFALTAAGGVAMVLVLLPLTERPVAAVADHQRRILGIHSWKPIFQLSAAGAVNGLGWGFIAGFYPVWFHLRYGAGVGLIGVLTAVSGLIMGPGFAFAARLARRWGEIRAITASRGAAVVVMALLPMMPDFAAAATAYLVWILLARMVMPLRQSFAMGIVDEGDRAASVGIRGTATRLPSAVGPVVTGYLLSLDEFALPFWLAAACQAINVALYYKFFHDDGDRHRPGDRRRG